MHLGKYDIMDKDRQAVSVTQLKSLLATIIDNGRRVCIRYRLIGGMWHNHHMRVLTVVEDNLMVHDEKNNKIITVRLSDIMQFELDGGIVGYAPHNHYEVSPYRN
jgi:hypothetical protein